MQRYRCGRHHTKRRILRNTSANAVARRARIVLAAAEAAIVETTDAGAIVAWTDGRNQLSTDIFALQVKEAGQDLTGVNTPPAAGVLVSVVPNPFSGSTRISVSSSGGGPVDVRIFDVLGRPVRSLVTARGASIGDVQWDGRTSGGSPAPSGIYFCRVSTPAGRAMVSAFGPFVATLTR